MAPTAKELLAEAAAAGEDLETVARGLLERLAQLTGLSSTYLAETRLRGDEQHIPFAYNSNQIFHIPPGETLPWCEAVSRFVREGSPRPAKDTGCRSDRGGWGARITLRSFSARRGCGGSRNPRAARSSSPSLEGWQSDRHMGSWWRES